MKWLSKLEVTKVLALCNEKVKASKEFARILSNMTALYSEELGAISCDLFFGIIDAGLVSHMMHCFLARESP